MCSTQVGDTTVVLDGGALLAWFATMATKSPEGSPELIDQLAHGSPQPIAEQVATKADPAQAVLIAEGQALNVFCSEWVPYASLDEELRLAQQAFPDFPDSVKAQPPQMPFIRQECNAWNVPKAPEAVRAVTASAIATPCAAKIIASFIDNPQHPTPAASSRHSCPPMPSGPRQKSDGSRRLCATLAPPTK
jgi:hypothetical protein